MPKLEEFTEPARRAMFLSREKAAQSGSPSIQGPHLLDALFAEREPELVEVLARAAVRVPEFVRAVAYVPALRMDVRREVPFGEELRTALEIAATHRSEHRKIGGAALLLGLLETKGATATLLAGLGVTPEIVRQVHREFLATLLYGRVTVVVGDITRQRVDAIVNAANASLLGGGGVDGAIHRAGGPTILEECRRIRDSAGPEGLPTGKAVVTGAGRLAARHVLHTVGPIDGASGGEEARLLATCYRSAETVAVPSISTGAYGYPREEAARFASGAIAEALSRDSSIREVRLVFFAPEDARVFLDHQIFRD